MIWVYDVSGSITDTVIAQMYGEEKIAFEDLQPEKHIRIYADAKVQKVEEFSPGDEITPPVSSGGGGTDFRPVFDWVESAGIQPDALVYLTDLYGSFPTQTPSYPVIWGSTSH
ncbi:MAG: VWA-like domain-containing protein, partial [bacterium]|nr:VWA-like domain-containing protein [bacterium]